MSTVSQFLGGGGSFGTPTLTRVLTTSAVVTVPKDGKARIAGVGPGGSGAVGKYANCSGGAAGGFGLAEIDVKKGDVITVVIGAPGSPATATGNNAASGNAGGTTTVTHNGVTRYLYGGEGGKTSGYNTSTAGVEGAEGGDAVGWDVNAKGGGSGSVATGGGAGATGGGAVNLFAVDPDLVSSGDVVSLGCSGGASPGGKSGDVIGQSGVSGGGGGGGPSPDVTGDTAGDGGPGLQVDESVPPLLSWPFQFPHETPGGTEGIASTAAVPTPPNGIGESLVGTGAVRSSVGSGGVFSGASSAFSGSGSVSTTIGSGNAGSGDAGLGAGSGAVIHVSGSTGTITSGSGGKSIVVIEVY